MLQRKENFKVIIVEWVDLKGRGLAVTESVQTDLAQLTHMDILGGINCLVEKRGWL